MMRYCCIIILVIFSFTTFSQTTPCSSDKHSEFHFWVGEWEVTENGKPAGTNTITLEQGTCLMVEKWTSANPPFTGSSYNHYDAQTNEWVQVWVDNSGYSLHTRGGMKNGSMVLSSKKMKDYQGNEVINRITWTPNEDGTVRQHWESTQDEGKTWATVFDGLYKKMNE